MYWSSFFIPTLKEDPLGTEAISHKLLLRAGLVHMLTSGVYSYLPLGLKVLKNIEGIIREEMESAGAIELHLPCLHPIELWKQTGRDEVMDDIMIKFENNRKQKMCLGPTHEEVITDLVGDFVQSYKQLPVTLYQIQTKFRDELRVRFGVVRACEFVMKDAYSFDRDEEGLKKNYEKMYNAYCAIFKRLGLDVVIVEADSGAMGGSVSHEFLIPAEIGEDTVEVEVDGKKEKTVAMELGHIFQLGTKYTSAQKVHFVDEQGQQKPIIMGCYGIGVSRVVAAIIEKHSDEKGIIWPAEVAPFDVEIVPIFKSHSDETLMLAKEIHDKLEHCGVKVLLDDRDESAGRKFNDADLIGIPLRVTVGARNLKEGKIEMKHRSSSEVNLVDRELAIETITEVLESHA